MTTEFADFGLPPKLLQALSRLQYTTPTPIQAKAIPLAMAGRDILGSAQTGTGKTAAFGIPVIAQLMAKPDAVALIITPTRELASQVLASLLPLLPGPDIKTAVLIGGEAMPRQLKQLSQKPRLIVGTPGRINDHLERKSLKLDRVEFLVLDETDRMLDMGFGVQIERITKTLPKNRQTLLFSATLPDHIVRLAQQYLRDPERIAVGSTTQPVDRIKQSQINVSDADKYDQLTREITARDGSIIIFVKTKWGADKLARRLNRDSHAADAIHGDLRQRQRERAIENFRDSKCRILVATDVAARGLDVPHVAHVINYDLPQNPEDYIHRIGRTARAGAEGEALSFLTGADRDKWRAIQKLLGHKVANDRGERGAGGGQKSGGGKAGFKPRRHQDRARDDRPRDGGRKKFNRPDRPDRNPDAANPFDKRATRRPDFARSAESRDDGAPKRAFAKKPRTAGARNDPSRHDRNRDETRSGPRPFVRSEGKKPFAAKSGDAPRRDNDGGPRKFGKPYAGKADGAKKSFARPGNDARRDAKGGAGGGGFAKRGKPGGFKKSGFKSGGKPGGFAKRGRS